MSKFEKPIEGEIIKYESTEYKKSFYDLGPGLIVKSPFEGKVVEATKLSCTGKFRIEHEVNDSVFYSNFCNLNGGYQIYSEGHNLIQGKKIGETGNDKLEYWITDKRNEKQDIKTFFSNVTSNRKNREEKNKKEEEGKKKKEEDEKKKKQSENKNKRESDNTKTSSKTSYDSGGSTSSTIVTKDTPMPFTDLFSIPINLIHKTLKEDIQRIKQLMK